MSREPTDWRTDVPKGLYIDGQWMLRSSAGSRAHVNPATGMEHYEFVVAGAQEIDAAVHSARSALRQFADWTGPQRRDALRRIASSLRRRSDELADLSTLETGVHRRVTDSIGSFSADWFDYYAGWADKISGTVFPVPGALDYGLAQPFGVVAAIVSYNGPIGSIGMKVAPALAAGCMVVLKPPDLAPISSQVFAQICEEAGLPLGVVNVVTGDADAGDALVRHPQVDKITFTGGTATARKIQSACAESLTPLVLELGGKSANLVFADADLDVAVRAATASVLTRAGQSCITPSRLLVHESVYDEVIARVARLFDATVLGDPFDPNVDLGPVVSKAACERILAMIEDAGRNEHGRLRAGGYREGGPLASGFFVRPTLFTEVDNSTSIAREEVFGPVLTATPFANDDEAVELANDSELGLAAYLHTKSLERAHRVAHDLDAGNIGVNGGAGLAGPYAPFGGFKDSGYGSEGANAGLREFLKVKNVNIRLG